MTQTEALKLALDALENLIPIGERTATLQTKAITAIKEALTQPEQEPVACASLCVECTKRGDWVCAKAIPPQRTWVGLTTDDWDEIRKQVKYNFEMTTGEYAERVSHLVEDKLKEKNT